MAELTARPAEIAATTLPRWHGDGLPARSIRFTITLMAPLAAALVVVPGTWTAYALLASILAFLLDTGGPALRRLAAIGIAGTVVLLGGALGTLVAGSLVLTTVMLALSGVIYALVEGIHTSAAFAARFLCLTVSIGALYAPIQADYVPLVACFVMLAWLVSVGWDAVTGLWRPSTAPKLDDIISCLKETRRERWIFAAIVASAVAASFLAGKALGLDYPNWAVLAVVIVLRIDISLSRRVLANLMIGTVFGVAIGYAWLEFFSSPLSLIVGMMIASLLRWPAQKLHDALGLGAMAAFVVLLMQLVLVETGTGNSHAGIDRIIDIGLGCSFSVLALWLNGVAQKAFARQ